MSDALPRPIDVLPHRPPFLFVDEVTALVPGQSARGVWRLTGEEWFFPGHFPGRPTLPGVLMAESIAQLGAVAVLTDERFTGKLPLFGGLDSARFRRQVVPGDTLELEVELARIVGTRGTRQREGERQWPGRVRGRAAVRGRRRRLTSALAAHDRRNPVTGCKCSAPAHLDLRSGGSRAPGPSAREAA